MQLMEANIETSVELSARLIRRDGSTEDLGILEDRRWRARMARWIAAHPRICALFWLAVLLVLAGYGAAHLLAGLVVGIVTTAGVNYMATDFASGGDHPDDQRLQVPRLRHRRHRGRRGRHRAADRFRRGARLGHRLQPERQPVPLRRHHGVLVHAGDHRVGTVLAASAGTLWDRRVFSAINVVSGDSIQFTYTLTVNNGGS
jgi:hypothetical protein